MRGVVWESSGVCWLAERRFIRLLFTNGNILCPWVARDVCVLSKRVFSGSTVLHLAMPSLLELAERMVYLGQLLVLQ